MSTRSYIIVRVPDHMIGQTIEFDAKKLPVKVGECDYRSGLSDNGFYPIKEQEAAKRKPIVLEKKYIRIYHHHDGYPEGLGHVLMAQYNTLEAVLNLIAGGACSTCIGHYMGWAEYANYDEDMLPEQTDEPRPDESYSYLFEDGKWKYYDLFYDQLKRPHDLKAKLQRDGITMPLQRLLPLPFKMVDHIDEKD